MDKRSLMTKEAQIEEELIERLSDLKYTYRKVVFHTKNQPHKQHIWFLPTRKPTQKNQKSCFLPTLE